MTGIVDSLAQPGGNITGLTRLTRDLSGKRLELLTEVVPKMSRVGALTVADSTSPGLALKEYQAAARALKIPLQSLEVRGPKPDLEGAFREAVRGTRERAHNGYEFVAYTSRKSDCRPRYKESTTLNVRA